MTNLTGIAAALESDKLLFKTLADGSGVILDLDGSRVLALNPTGMFIVDLIQKGTSTQEAISARLNAEFDVDLETARADLASLLGELETHLPGAKA